MQKSSKLDWTLLSNMVLASQNTRHSHGIASTLDFLGMYQRELATVTLQALQSEALLDTKATE